MTTDERARLARGAELLDGCRSIVVEICRDPNAAEKLARDYEQIQGDLRALLSELDEDAEDPLPWRDIWHLLDITTGTEDEAVAAFNAVVGDYQALFTGIRRARPQWELEFYEEAGRHPVIEWAKKLPKARTASLFVALERILAYDGPAVANNSSRGRRLGGGLYEFKIGLCAAQTAGLFPGREGETEPEGPAKERTCLRVFFAVEGDRLLLLLAGYDKGSDDGRRRQDQETEIARHRLVAHRERKKRTD
jgi:hypothetical protein